MPIFKYMFQIFLANLEFFPVCRKASLFMPGFKYSRKGPCIELMMLPGHKISETGLYNGTIISLQILCTMARSSNHSFLRGIYIAAIENHCVDGEAPRDKQS